ncbi:hypothetical protein BD626DRAFT_483100 [Schizophyllum amplum]|uniref:F-box domain-containing protein n=1 Tax=Schizophyllum amplum TaxID=97359 RepID=A0A550CP84_9AGAR|nr:hypothetical protein BD626DRAFT_483100 [Auriculariopsis ampla]
MDLIRRRYSSTPARADSTGSAHSSNSGISSADYGRPGKPALLRQRVSSVFSPLKKRASVMSSTSGMHSESEAGDAVVVADNVAALGFLIREQDSDTETTDSIDDIRRPSGLGRTASFSSDRSHPSFAWTQESDCLQAPRIHHSISSPSLIQGLADRIRDAKSRHVPVHSIVQGFPLPPRQRVFDIPMEVLICIMAHLPRDSVTRAAVVAHGFAEAAQTVLYGRIDLRTVRPSRHGQLLALLASRPRITECVHAFICHSWPENEPPEEDSSVTSQPPALAHLAIALQNMPNLVTLTLPSFDVDVLRRHTAFGLRHLTFLNGELHKEEMQALFNWLDGQINITSFRLPELFDVATGSDRPTPQTQASLRPQTHALLASPMLLPVSPVSPITPVSPTFSVRGEEPYSYESPTLLPALQTLHASPSLVAALAPSRCLQHVTVNVDATLYTGLRPAALVAPLKGARYLGFKFGRQVDRRSMEKVLSAAGATLGGTKREDTESGREPTSGVESLTIYIASPDPGVDEVLYKIIHSVISRYADLHTIALNCAPSVDGGSLDFRAMASSPIPHPPTPPISPSLVRPGSAGFSASPMDRPTSVAFPSHEQAATPILTTASIITSPTSRLSHKERLHINSWVKLCPSLRVIKLLSGAEWRA